MTQDMSSALQIAIKNGTEFIYLSNIYDYRVKLRETSYAYRLRNSNSLTTELLH